MGFRTVHPTTRALCFLSFSDNILGWAWIHAGTLSFPKSCEFMFFLEIDSKFRRLASVYSYSSLYHLLVTLVISGR